MHRKRKRRGAETGVAGGNELDIAEFGVLDDQLTVAKNDQGMLDLVRDPVVAADDLDCGGLDPRECILPVVGVHELDDRVFEPDRSVADRKEITCDPKSRVRQVPDRQRAVPHDDNVLHIHRFGDHNIVRDDPGVVSKSSQARECQG
ncbi:MAG: hypothetical protein OQK55_07130 [Thermoanaerobaculales bacterium]|nr:hypothetical protein [Thermoanaerobaculales bacterium]